MKSFSDEEVQSDDWLDDTLETFQALYPLNNFLNEALEN